MTADAALTSALDAFADQFRAQVDAAGSVEGRRLRADHRVVSGPLVENSSTKRRLPWRVG
jgi:hypothetical protein